MEQAPHSLLLDLCSKGALLEERVIMDHGEPRTWADLLSEGLVDRLYTSYGRVLILTSLGRQHMLEAGEQPDYLAGTSSAATRAFQVEASRHLEDLGYGFERFEFKTRSGLNPGSDRTHTDQIVRFRVSPPQYTPPHPGNPEYPVLYATPTVNTAYVRRAVRQHKNESIRLQWPVIIAIPEMTTDLVQGLHVFGRTLQQRGEGLLIPHLVVVPRPGAATPTS